jgi:hypothetical protein
MDVWKWVAIGAALWAIAGCHTPQAITALERECRMLEDQIYMLEDELSRAESALEACQSRSTAPARAITTPPNSSPAPRSSVSPSLQGPQSPPIRDGGRPPADPIELRLPEVDSGRPLPPGVLPDTLVKPPQSGSQPGSPRLNPRESPPASPPGMAPPSGKASSYRGTPRSRTSLAEPRVLAGPGPGRRLPPPVGADRTSQRPRGGVAQGPPHQGQGTHEGPSEARRDPKLMTVQAIALDPRADNTRADRITLNRALTGGYSHDARFGDAGVSVLIEPRDAHGRLVPAAGPVSVVVLDRGRSGDAARVARWDFTAEQISTLYRKTPYGEGIYLEMPWPGSPPERGHLHLFVRYTTQDGRNLEASCELDVALPRREPAWQSLSSAEVEPPRVQAASAWRQKARAEEPPPAAVVDSPSPAKGASVVTASSPAEPSSLLPASATEPVPAAASKSSGPPRPTWSPLRPEQ